MHILLGTATAHPMEKELSHPTFLLDNLAILSSMNRLSRIEDLSYHDMQQRVFESCGGILLGWRDFSKYHPELNPNLKHQINEWDDSQAALVQNMCLIFFGWKQGREEHTEQWGNMLRWMLFFFLGFSLGLEDMSNFELIILRPPDKLPGALGWRDVFFLIGNVAAPIFRVVGKVQKGWPSRERFQKMFTNGYVQKGAG